MAHLRTRGFSDADADAFKVRANGPHTLRWKANAYQRYDSNEHLLYEDLPIVGGRLSLDSSEATRRHLTMEIAGLGDLVPDDPGDPLSCFGQYIRLYCTIDRQGGDWFPWLQMGEYPIQTTTSEWPSLEQSVECDDWSAKVEECLHANKRSYSKFTVEEAIRNLTQFALPNRAFEVIADEDAQTTMVHPNTVADSGSGRWETAVSIAQTRGFETFFDSNADCIIRHDITQDDDESIPGVGPDIGTVSNPVAVIRDGTGGNLVSLTASATREGACNGVYINLAETASQSLRTEGRPASGDKRVNVQVSALGTGSIEWANTFGRVPVVIEKQVRVITDNLVTAQQQRAKRLLRRRGGIIRSLDMDTVGLYWVEPDDRVRIQYAGRTEAHFVASIEFDLAGQEPTRIRTRSLNVEDVA